MQEGEEDRGSPLLFLGGGCRHPIAAGLSRCVRTFPTWLRSLKRGAGPALSSDAISPGTDPMHPRYQVSGAAFGADFVSAARKQGLFLGLSRRLGT